jgi:hypothetical protein
MNNGGWGTSRTVGVNTCGHSEARHYAKGLCRACYRNSPHMQVKRREYYLANPEQWARHTRLAKERRSKAVSLYGVSLAEQHRMLDEQGHLCALCRQPPGKKGLGIDHCHATGRIRAFLCSRCNTGLGLLRDDPSLCDRAAAYLRHHSVLPEAVAARSP